MLHNSGKNQIIWFLSFNYKYSILPTINGGLLMVCNENLMGLQFMRFYISFFAVIAVYLSKLPFLLQKLVAIVLYKLLKTLCEARKYYVVSLP